jgi:hypothetical protein
MLYLASTPLVARWAAWTLEKDYPPVDVKTLPVDSAIAGPKTLYTADESEGIVQALASRGIHRVIPCTSAMHL